MPLHQKKPPAPKQQAGDKRPVEPAGAGSIPAKRPSSGTFVPEVPFSSGRVERQLVITVVGELNDIQVDNIRLWRLVNPDLPIKVVLDPDSVLVGRLTRYIVLSTKLDLEANGIYWDHGGQLTPDDSDTVHYQVLRRKEQAYHDIRTDVSSSGKNWGKAIEDWLIRQHELGNQNSRYATHRGEIEQIRQQQGGLIERLKENQITLTEERVAPNAGFIFEEIYRDTVYKWGSLQDGENLLRAKVAYEEGGIYADWRRRPALKEAFFNDLKTTLSPAEWVDAQFVIQQVALDRWEMAEPGIFLGRVAEKEHKDFPDYRLLLERWQDRPGRPSAQSVLETIATEINRHPRGGVFAELPDYRVGNSGILIGGLDSRTTIKPVAFAARKGSPVLKQYLEDGSKTHRFVEKYAGLRPQSNLVRQGYIDKWRAYHDDSGAKPTFEDFTDYETALGEVAKSFNQELIAYNPDWHYGVAIRSQPYTGMENGDLEGHLSGTPALLESYYNTGADSYPEPFSDTTASTETMDRYGKPRIYTFDDNFIFQPVSDAKRVVIVQLSNDVAITRFSSNLYNRYDSSRINSRVSPTVAWWQWNHDQGKLKLYDGHDFMMRSDDKLLLVGHGTGGDVTKANRIEGLTENRIVDILDGTEPVDASIKRILPEPKKFTLKKIEVIVCNSCDVRLDLTLRPGQSITLTEAYNDAINPRLLLEFSRRGYVVGKIVGSPFGVIVGGHGDRYAYKPTSIADGGVIAADPVIEHKQAGNWHEYTLESKKEGDQVIRVIRVTVKQTSGNTNSTFKIRAKKHTA